MENNEDISNNIRHVLEIWPVLSPTLLQAALGPQVRSKQWRPVLEEMILTGVVIQETITKQSPAGRHQNYQRLSLSNKS